MSSPVVRYRAAKQRRLDGKYNGAPLFYSFPRFGELVPAIPRGCQVMLLAGSGTGKSQSIIGLLIMPVYKLIKEYNYKAEFLIFLLEDPRERFEDRLFSRVLAEYFGIFIDPEDLNSWKKNIMSDEVDKVLDTANQVFLDILSYCTIVDNVYNPTGIYKAARTYSGERGEHKWVDKEFTYKKSDSSTHKEMTKVYSSYTPKDPEVHTFVVNDNLNNLSEEAGGTIHQAITAWCRNYARLQIVKHWNYTVWNIMQTALEYDKKQFTSKGESIIEKLEPTLNALGDNKLVARDHHLVLSLFAPSRFGIEEYEGYNTLRLDDNFRVLTVLKSNFCTPNRKICLYFNGVCSHFKELPKAKEMTEEIYKIIETNKVKFI